MIGKVANAQRDIGRSTSLNTTSKDGTKVNMEGIVTDASVYVSGQALYVQYQVNIERFTLNGQVDNEATDIELWYDQDNLTVE